ncbi:MAG TPA: Hsp20/alpha crystallin family protein, partial [Vicinamibacterales bacterium]|nr:Hsp20/alpha crystallin family protein [Vicinamibacterales bacterium]
TQQEVRMPDKPTEITQHEGSRMEQRGLARAGNPFAMLDRFADEMARMFDDVGFGRGWLSPRGNAALRTSGAMWAPQIEVYQRSNELVIRADLPGIKKEDVTIEVTDDEITISGERHEEKETDREGIFRSERTYGSFYRTIPLPEGAITDQAKASFKDGVLEITIPAPPQTTRGRRLDIKDAEQEKK